MINWAFILHFYQPPTQDEVIIEQTLESCYLPILDLLIQHPKARMSLNISGSLTLRLAHMHREDFFTKVRQLLQSNQIELVNCPLYHPIMPLNTGDIWLRQLEYNAGVLHHYYHSYPISVVFPPELATSDTVLQDLNDKYQAVLVDESAVNPFFDHEKIANHVLYRYHGLKLIASSRLITEIVRSYAHTLNPQKFIEWVKSNISENQFICSINDAEIFGHHYEERIDFLKGLTENPNVYFWQVSELLKNPPEDEFEVNTTISTSWITQPKDIAENNNFPLWNNLTNPLQQKYLNFLNYTYEVLRETPKPKDDTQLRYGSAEKHFDRGTSSCHLYWLSNWPWWNPQIAEDGARELIKCIRSLPINHAYKREGERLFVEFLSALWNYHWSDEPQIRYDQYNQYQQDFANKLPNLS